MPEAPGPSGQVSLTFPRGANPLRADHCPLQQSEPERREHLELRRLGGVRRLPP